MKIYRFLESHYTELAIISYICPLEFNILYQSKWTVLEARHKLSNHSVKSLKTLGITTSPRALKFIQSRIPLELQWESQHLPLSVKEEQMQLFTCTLPGLFWVEAQESSNSSYGQKALRYLAKSIPHPPLEQPCSLTNAHKQAPRSTCPATQGKWIKTNIPSLNAACELWLHFPFWFCSPSVLSRHRKFNLFHKWWICSHPSQQDFTGSWILVSAKWFMDCL